MIRIRIGHRWKREPASPPHDSVALELDGVNLLVGAVEEPLAEAVPALVQAVATLHAGRQRLAQVSLAEARLEVVLRRTGPDIELQIASLGRPARLLRPPLRVEAEELARAAQACGADFLADVAALAPGALRPEAEEALRRAVQQLGGPSPYEEEPRPQAFSVRGEPPRVPGFGFALEDGEDLLRTYARGRGPGLGSLLCGGEVWLALPGQAVAWRAKGPPFLTALELSRQALELARAVELGEERHEFEPAGVRPRLAVEVGAGRVRAGQGRPVEVGAGALAAAMFHLGQGLALAVAERERSQAGNPYLVELTERCREGLSHLREAVPPPESSQAPRARPAAVPGATRPLRTAGRLRRLRFERRWEQRKLGGAEQGRLLLGRQGPVFSAPQLACAFERQSGMQLWRRAASHGVAANGEGYSLAASSHLVCGFYGKGAGARWMHDHDGVRVGPLLLRQEGLLLTLSEERVVLAFAEVTGRELWRLAPPRTRRSHLALQGHRALLGTESGYLYGLDAMDGQVRFRMSASLPFTSAPVAWGRRFLALLGQGPHAVLLLADAHTGQAGWTRELPLARASLPLPLKRRVYVAGEREGEGVLLGYDAGGQLLWERALPLGPGPYALARHGESVLVSSPLGAAARVSAEGRLEWRLGGTGEPLAAALPPVLSRGVVLLAGSRVRAVEPEGGRVLAEVDAGAGLVGLLADGQLNLYTLDEAGTLCAWRLASHFAVVEG